MDVIFTFGDPGEMPTTAYVSALGDALLPSAAPVPSPIVMGEGLFSRPGLFALLLMLGAGYYSGRRLRMTGVAYC
jgi:hypothetical protein